MEAWSGGSEGKKKMKVERREMANVEWKRVGNCKFIIGGGQERMEEGNKKRVLEKK